jgi:hypothetical protein
MEREVICRFCYNKSKIDSSWLSYPVGAICPYCHNYLWNYHVIPQIHPLMAPFYSWDINFKPRFLKLKKINNKPSMIIPLILAVLLSIMLISTGVVLFLPTVYMHEGQKVPVNGYVYDNNTNTGLPYVKVYYIGQYGSYVTYTNKTGYFRFASFPSGVFILNFSEVGYSKMGAKVLVSKYNANTFYISLNKLRGNNSNYTVEPLTTYLSWDDYIASILSSAFYALLWGVLTIVASMYIYNRYKFAAVLGIIGSSIIIPIVFLLFSTPTSSIFLVIYLLSVVEMIIAIITLVIILNNRHYFSYEFKEIDSYV